MAFHHFLIYKWDLSPSAPVDKLKRLAQNCEPLMDKDQPKTKHKDDHNTANLWYSLHEQS